MGEDEGAEGAAAPGGDDPGSARGLGVGAAGRTHPRLRRPDSGSGEGSARGEGSECEGEGGRRLLLLLLLLQGGDAAGTVQDAVLGAAGEGVGEGGEEVLLPHRGVLQGGDEVQTGPFPDGTSQDGVLAVPQGGAPVVTPGGGGDDASCAEEEVVGPPGGETCDVIAYDGAET